jgi:hypothetical protein
MDLISLSIAVTAGAQSEAHLESMERCSQIDGWRASRFSSYDAGGFEIRASEIVGLDHATGLLIFTFHPGEVLCKRVHIS